MHLYLELWKAKPAWRALAPAQREAFVAGLGPAIEKLLADGIELVGFARTDADTSHRAGYDYVAAWRMPTRELAVSFERTVDGSGFHDYFEQVNARGEIEPAADVLARMARDPA